MQSRGGVQAPHLQLLLTALVFEHVRKNNEPSGYIPFSFLGLNHGNSLSSGFSVNAGSGQSPTRK